MYNCYVLCDTLSESIKTCNGSSKTENENTRKGVSSYMANARMNDRIENWLPHLCRTGSVRNTERLFEVWLCIHIALQANPWRAKQNDRIVKDNGLHVTLSFVVISR
jgi:hypothetical protein